MKVTLSWLREFAPDIDGDPVELGETLSALGLAVEEMEVVGEIVDGVVLAKVLDLRPHPDADKIQLVDAGKPSARRSQRRSRFGRTVDGSRSGPGDGLQGRTSV